MRPAAPHPFTRKPVQGSEYRLIESKCALCGFRIVGSASDTLEQDEDDHANNCAKKKLKQKRRISRGF